MDDSAEASKVLKGNDWLGREVESTLNGAVKRDHARMRIVEARADKWRSG
jgi:hypothetical protein